MTHHPSQAQSVEAIVVTRATHLLSAQTPPKRAPSRIKILHPPMQSGSSSRVSFQKFAPTGRTTALATLIRRHPSRLSQCWWRSYWRQQSLATRANIRSSYQTTNSKLAHNWSSGLLTRLHRTRATKFMSTKERRAKTLLKQPRWSQMEPPLERVHQSQSMVITELSSCFLEAKLL